MYILWIDPWVRKLWYALIDQQNNIIDSWILLDKKKSPTRLDYYDRISKIEDFFLDISDKYDISKISVEKLFFTNFNQSNAEFVYGIRAILINMFFKKWVKLYEYTPKELKKYITWNWNASKDFVKQFVFRVFWLENLPEYDDAADALWLAYIANRLN